MKTIKDKYYDYVLHTRKNTKFSTEEQLVFSIMQDFTDRRGLRQAWEQIDDDIQEEIIKEWIEIIKQWIKITKTIM